MTPYYGSVGQAIQARLAELHPLDTDVDVIVHASRRTGNDQASRERPAE